MRPHHEITIQERDSYLTVKATLMNLNIRKTTPTDPCLYIKSRNLRKFTFHNRNMKAFVFVLLLALTAAKVLKKEDCKCWEDFKVEENENGGFYCRSVKHHRIFGCNEEKPPLCECLKDGKLIKLDLGHTDCLSVDLNNGRWCQNKEDFVEYFKQHPERAIYD